MSYFDEVFQMVVEKNPAQPEFHQAVKEVLDSLRVVIEANEEEYKKQAFLDDVLEPYVVKTEGGYVIALLDCGGKPYVAVEFVGKESTAAYD